MTLFSVFSFVLLVCSDGLLLSNVEQSLVSQLQSQINTMNATMQTMSAQIHALENKSSTPTVAFLAELGHDLFNPAVGTAVIFDVVHLNDGTAYNSKQGVFTAPFSGVYHFTLELSGPQSTSSHRLHVHLMHSSVRLGYIYLDKNQNSWLKHSTTTTVHLTAGNDIWVEVTLLDGPGRIGGCCYHSIFSGFLIKAD